MSNLQVDYSGLESLPLRSMRRNCKGWCQWDLTAYDLQNGVRTAFVQVPLTFPRLDRVEARLSESVQCPFRTGKFHEDHFRQLGEPLCTVFHYTVLLVVQDPRVNDPHSPTQQSFFWIAIDVVRECNRHIRDQREHPVEVAGFTVMALQPLDLVVCESRSLAESVLRWHVFGN